MLSHIVIFWLRTDLTAAERAEFETALRGLSAVRSLSGFAIGRPAATGDRPVVDRSYDFMLTTLFADMAAHDAYQVDPLHKEFVRTQSPKWARVQIYDAQ
jgi:hypothetical protein